MMEGNPSLRSMLNSQEISMLLTSPSPPASSSLTSLSSSAPAISVVCPRSLQLSCQENQELSVVSWSQLLLGEIVEEEEGILSLPANQEMACVKEESEARHDYYFGKDKERRYSWSSPQLSAAAANFSPSPKCSATSSSILDFSHSNAISTRIRKQSHHLDHSNTEYNSNRDAASKKPRVQSSPVQSPLKVRKEKLGDRVAALHHLVSPFGKTDTASVLTEAIGYITFLQTQLRALTSPYSGNVSSSMNTSTAKSGGDDGPNALRSRGLCLVPVSFLLHLGSDDNGVDLWSHNFGMALR